MTKYRVRMKKTTVSLEYFYVYADSEEDAFDVVTEGEEIPYFAEEVYTDYQPDGVIEE